MSGRPRHSQSGASEDPYKIWRPQERQVESDSERPRYRTTNTSQSQRNQEESRSYSSTRGYKSDSPTAASASQNRSGPSSSKPLHHPSRPSVSTNYVSRSQQPAASTSTTPAPQAQHHSRSQPQRSQPEAYSSRVYLQNRNTSTPTPQSSHERVPSADEFAKASRPNPYSRTGHAPQPTPIPEVWIPPTQDPSLSRKYRDRDRDREREREKDRDREREKETGRDRNRERERPKDSYDRRRERDVERRDDAFRDPTRDAYRDRDRAKEREKDRYQERRVEEEREPIPHRELRSTSKPASTWTAQDTRTRDPTTTSTSNHRRHRSEEAPSSSAAAWRPQIDSKQPFVAAPPVQKPIAATHPTSAAQTTTSGGQTNVPPPTPRVMPVYLPAKQPSTYKPSHERSYSTPAALTQKENSTSDSEQTSRRELQFRAANDSRLAITTPTVRDNSMSRPQKDQADRPPETVPLKGKHEARYQNTRSKPLGTQPPPAPVLKPPDVGENILQVPSGGPASSLSVLPTENHRYASAKPQIVSIRAGQGPSDPQTSDALFKKSARSIRESRPDVSEKLPTLIQPSSSRVQEQVKRYEAAIPAEVPLSTSTRAHANNVEQSTRSMPTKPYPSQSATSTSQDRSQAREVTTRAEVTSSSRAQASHVEPSDRRSTFQPPTHQLTSASHDRTQSHEVSVRPEVATPTPLRAHVTGVEPDNGTEPTPKPSTNQSASLNNGLQQSNEASVKPDMVPSTLLRVRTTDIEINHRSATAPKPSLSQPGDAAASNRLPKARTVRFDLPPLSPSPPPVATSIETTSLAPHTSRPATASVNEVRSSPISGPLLPSSSSVPRQTSTPPQQSNQKLSSSPQTKDSSTLHLPRVIDKQSLAPSAAHPPVTSSQLQATAGEVSTSLPISPQVSPARSIPSQADNTQTENSQRFVERTVTALALPLTVVSSQSQSTPISVQTTPSQSTSRSTKTSDALSARQHDKHGPPVEQSFRQDAWQADVAPYHNQPLVPGPQISSAADQHRMISETSRQEFIASSTQPGSTGATLSTAAPTSQTMHPQSHAINGGDPTRKEHVIDVQPAAGDTIQLPALSPNHPKSHSYTVLQPEQATGRQPQTFSSEDARLPSEPSQRFTSVSAKAPGPEMHSSAAALVTQAHTQGNVMHALSGGSRSRHNSIDVSAARPKIQHHAPAPQILVEDSPHEVPRREVFSVTASMSQSKSLPHDPILSAPTPISAPQASPALQTTRSRDMPDSENPPEPRLARPPNTVPLTSVNLTTSTSASSQQPTIGIEPFKPRALLNEDLLSANTVSHKKQDSSASPDAAEDTVLLRSQLRDEPAQVRAKVGKPVSYSASVDQSRSSQDPALDNASRTMSSRGGYQSAKQPDRHSPRPQNLPDLPQSTFAPSIKMNPQVVASQQPVPARTVLHGSHPEDLGQWSGTSNQRGSLPKTAPLAARNVSHSVNVGELQSPQLLNYVTHPLVKGDVHSKENADDYKAVRQRDQDDTLAPTALERQRGDIYQSASRAPSGMTALAQDPPSRFPVVEDVMQRPGTAAGRPERQKFTYGPASTPALDPHHDLLSPVQQAIRAVPTSQIPPRSLSHDTQPSDLRSRGQTDVPSAVSSQPVTSRSQPYNAAPMPVSMASSASASQPLISASVSMKQGMSSNNVNSYNSSRPDESITPPRTTPSSAYPSASRYPTATTYPTASNRYDSHSTATPNAQQSGPQIPHSTGASQQAPRYASVQYSQSPPVPDIPQSNFISRASDAARKAPVNRVQAYPELHSSALNPTFAPESTGTHRHNVSLTNVTSQPAAIPHLPAQKSSSNSIKPSYSAPPPPAGSSYHPRPDPQQPTVSTRVAVSGHLSTSTPLRSRLPSQPPRNTSKESILLTPSSLAPSMLPKADHSRVPPMVPISRQESNQSKDSHKKKNGFLNIFRSKAPTPAQKSYEVWHPPTSDRQRNQSQISLQSTGKVPVVASSSSTIDGVASTSHRKGLAPIAVDLPLHAAGRKEPDQKIFSAFKFLHTKRNRTVSHASIEAQDGQTQTATNTVVGSPTQSNRSQPFAPPPVRDPQLAAQEWRNREEAEMRSRAKRRRPGVVFDMEEDPPEPPPGTLPKKKLSRRRQ